ncbi:DNA polymerase III beta subunit [Geothermobacter ehrlichii]|uniref:Beta sliding clamp n=1 Tax=Geothermobacter ehrlichii TaxID=213224 RepID=A0A5D3WIP2_9BACT|nr:DNA polymerase III subunit beta [Geothermobacter ehrlichii]TYO97670.1 DNA polymerase III beta subunit [Geothermobacter ehrlichii]
MQFSIEREIFLKALARVQGIVEKRNTIPILSNVLIVAEQNEIVLTATDLEVGMRASYPAEVSKPGKVTVSARKLFEIIKELPEDRVSFQAKENCWIELSCGKALFNIVGLAADEFPYFPEVDQCRFLTLPSKVVSDMLEKTAFSMSTDESKYNLNGIFFQTLDVDGRQMLRLVATDGHRLALVQRELEDFKSEELAKGVIFPKKGVLELRKIAEEGESRIDLGFLENNAIIRKDTTTIVMRLIDGEFPDYNRVIPQDQEIRARIPRDTFFHALRRMAILSSEKSRGVKLSLTEGKLEISSSNPELGDAREDFEVDYAGQEIAIGFNARYLLDILQVQDADEISLQIRDNMSPGMIRPVDDDNFLAVVMPMRL